MLDRIAKFTCPHCGVLVGCDDVGKLGMYSLKIYNRHVERCQEVLEAVRSGDAEETERARNELQGGDELS